MKINVNYVYNINCIMIGNRANSEAHVETYAEVLSMDNAVKKALRIIDEYNLDSLDILDAETGEVLIQCASEEGDVWDDIQEESRRYLYEVPVPNIEEIRAAYKYGDHIRIGWIVGTVNAIGSEHVYIENGISPDHIPHGFDKYFLRSYFK